VKLCDVNVLVYAFRRDAERHEEYRSWLDDLVNGDAAFAVSEWVLAGFLRVVTHPRVFREPSTFGEALEFVEAVRSSPVCRVVAPSGEHWPLFVRLCEAGRARGNLIPDAWHAALAIEAGCTWMSTDRGFSRFPGLVWGHPLDDHGAVENPAR
jgi:hypothetical protein